MVNMAQGNIVCIRVEVKRLNARCFNYGVKGLKNMSE